MMARKTTPDPSGALIRLGATSVDAVEYAIQGNAILGIRDSGKSYTATVVAEQLFEAGIPFVAFDPIGVWRFLRVPGAGINARGFPVVVAGGEAGDLPLSPATAPAIVEAAMREGVSLVIDLFDISLSKADWRKIVRDCVRLLLHRNKAHGLRHVFIEEAAEFVPQKVLDGEVYAELEKLARMGGNSGLGYTLINQRSQEVSKAILELCENIFLHRQRGKNALDNLDRWLLAAGARAAKEITASLPDLPQGECWAWIGGRDPQPPTRTRIQAKQSLHPDRRMARGDMTAAARPVDVQAFVVALRAALPDEPAPEPAKLRAGAPPSADMVTRTHMEQEVVRARGDGLAEGYASGWKAGRAELIGGVQAYVLKALDGDATPPVHTTPASAARDARSPFPATDKPTTPASRAPGAPKPVREKNPRSGESAGKRLLVALAGYSPHAIRWDELCVAAGVLSGNGHFYGGRKWLVESGFVRDGDEADTVAITTEGLATAHTHSDRATFTRPTRTEILAHWKSNRRKPAPRMLDALESDHGWWTTDELSLAIESRAGNGHWYGGIKSLRDAHLIEESVEKHVRLHPFIAAHRK